MRDMIGCIVLSFSAIILYFLSPEVFLIMVLGLVIATLIFFLKELPNL